jgi:hypothetical protein
VDAVVRNSGFDDEALDQDDSAPRPSLAETGLFASIDAGEEAPDADPASDDTAPA